MRTNYCGAQRAEFHMVVIGDGHARAEFEAMIPGARIFVGYQSGLTFAGKFCVGGYFYVSSTTETFGLVTLEAMSSGLAPVTSKTGGAVESIEEDALDSSQLHSNGEDLANKVRWLLEASKPEDFHCCAGASPCADVPLGIYSGAIV